MPQANLFPPSPFYRTHCAVRMYGHPEILCKTREVFLNPNRCIYIYCTHEQETPPDAPLHVLEPAPGRASLPSTTKRLYVHWALPSRTSPSCRHCRSPERSPSGGWAKSWRWTALL